MERSRGKKTRRGSSVLSGGVSDRTGSVPARRMELYPEVTQHVAMAGQGPGPQFIGCEMGKQPPARTFQACLWPALGCLLEGVLPSGLTSYSGGGGGVLPCRLTALPFRVAEFQVPAGASGVLAGALGAADALNLVVEGLECGIHLGVMLPQVAGCLVGPHVLHGVGAFLSPA